MTPRPSGRPPALDGKRDSPSSRPPPRRASEASLPALSCSQDSHGSRGGRLPHAEVAEGQRPVRRGAAGRGDEPVEAEVEEDASRSAMDSSSPTAGAAPAQALPSAPPGPRSMALRSASPSDGDMRRVTARADSGRTEGPGAAWSSRGPRADAGSSRSPDFDCRVEQKAAWPVRRVSVSPTATCSEERQAPRS